MYIAKPDEVERNRRLIAHLMQNGYIPGRKVGEGCFREVYEVLLKKGALRKRLIAKIEKKKNEDYSVQHLINLSKGDLLENEIGMLGMLRHTNIAEIHDVLIQDKERIIIEEYFDALSLEQLVGIRGKVQNNAFFRHVFSQVLDALFYLHIEREILHRDLKPSNILVARRGDLVKITDFQNAKKLEDLSSEACPTRGGTSFTHPELLNTLLTGTPGCASLKTEFYSLGASMYFFLTGEAPFRYQIIAGGEGQKVRIGDKLFFLELQYDGKRLPMIDPEYHEACLEEKLGRIPLRYQKLLRYLLSMHTHPLEPKDLHSKVREDFADATYETGIVVRPVNFAGHKKLARAKTAQQPILSGEKINQEFPAFLEELVAYVLRYGKREVTIPYFREGGRGSDAVRSVIYCERYSHSSPHKPSLVVEEMNDSYIYGTHSQGWRETFKRTLGALIDGKIVLRAEKFLRGESGHIMEHPTVLEPLPWKVQLYEGFHHFFNGMSVFSEKEQALMQRMQDLCDTGFIENEEDLIDFLNSSTAGVKVFAEQDNFIYNRKMKAGEVGGFFTFHFDGMDVFSPFVRFSRELIMTALAMLDNKGAEYDPARKNISYFREYT